MQISEAKLVKDFRHLMGLYILGCRFTVSHCLQQLKDRLRKSILTVDL